MQRAVSICCGSLVVCAAIACHTPPSPPPAPARTSAPVGTAHVYAGALDGEWLALCAVDGVATRGSVRLEWMPAAARQLDRAASAASLDAGSTGRWEMTPQRDGSVRFTPTSLDPARGIFVQVRGVPPPPVHPAADGTLTIEIPSPPVRVVALLEVSEGISRCS